MFGGRNGAMDLCFNLIELSLVCSAILVIPVSLSHELPAEAPLRAPGQLSIYRQVLRAKRIEQREAVMRLSEFKDFKKQLKMLEPIVKKILEVLEKSKVAVPQHVDVSHFDLLISSDKNSVSLVLENTLFLGDILLRIPDVTHKILKKQSRSRDMLQWAIVFANTTGFLEYGDMTTLDLMSQELDLVPRRDNYLNVYTEQYKLELRLERLEQKEKLKEITRTEKKKSKSRPLMSGPLAGDL